MQTNPSIWSELGSFEMEMREPAVIIITAVAGLCASPMDREEWRGARYIESK